MFTLFRRHPEPEQAEYLKPEYSIWYQLDRLLCLGVLFPGSWVAMIFKYYSYIWMCSIPALLLLTFFKKLYDKTIPRSTKFQKTTTIIRSVIYTVVVGAAVFPMTLAQHDWKWAYPIERAIFLEHYDKDSTLYTVIPEHLPKQADRYSSRFVPAILQGSAAVDIFYYTDSQTIAEYKTIADSYGAEHFVNTAEELPVDEKISESSKWFYTMQDYGASQNDLDGAEAFVFSHGYANTAVWMLNETTGYFRAYW